VAAIASIKRELGGKWAVGIVLLQCGIAWVCALVVHLIGLLF
jgi:ferrous iron transport protein B